MSETPTEPVEPDTEPTEPVEPTGPVEPDTEPTEPVSPTDPVEPGEGARDDREIEALYARLETRAKNYVKSAGEILEGSGVPLAICELCADAYPGLRWLEAQDELHAALLAAIGENGRGAPLNDDRDAEECPKCGGWGVVRLPSHVPGNEQRICSRCNGAGYLVPHPESGTQIAPSADAANGPTEPIAGVPIDDPAVADLRARGFTIIPPMRIAEPAQ